MHGPAPVPFHNSTSPSDPDARPLRLILGIVGAAAVLMVVSILGSVALMLLAARQLDRMEAVDEIEITQRTIVRTLERTERELTSATVWDAAYKAMGWKIDRTGPTPTSPTTTATSSSTT
jgi:hypothetical protein